MNFYLIEPYNAYQKSARKKHWTEIAEEESLYYKMIQESLNQDDEQIQNSSAVGIENSTSTSENDSIIIESPIFLSAEIQSNLFFALFDSVNDNIQMITEDGIQRILE